MPRLTPVRVRRAPPKSRFCTCLPGKLDRYRKDLADARVEGKLKLAKLLTARIKGIAKMLRTLCHVD